MGEVSGSLSLGVGAGLLYSQITKAFAKSVDSIFELPEFQNLDPNKKAEVMIEITKNKQVFNYTGGALLVISLYSIIRFIANVTPASYSISLNTNTSEVVETSLLPFSFNNKIPK